MLVGTGREIVNPEIGHNLRGYGDRYFNQGVHDDLACTALYLNDGARQAIVLNFDLLAFLGKFVDQVRDAVSQKTGVARDNILTACTHTHSGPEVMEGWMGQTFTTYRPEYNRKLLVWAAGAAAAAMANAEECDLYYNYAFANENMNRRYSFPDRRFQYIPQNKQLVGCSDGYVDHELGIIAFRKRGTDSQYKALITVFTCHPLNVGNSSLLASADYQGYLRKTVEETFAGCTCLAMTGAAGDNHPLMPESGFARAEQMGRNLASLAIARCYDAIHADYDTNLRMAWRPITLPGRDQRSTDLLPEASDRQRAADLAKIWPQFTKPWNTHIALLGIGPLLLVGMPGEPVAELGAMIKWSSPFLRAYPLFLTTDAVGYIPTSNMYMWGGYEPVTSPLAQGAGEQLVREVTAASHELLERQPLKFPIRDKEAIGY